ncbi:thiamine biosynthesis lipoprotein [Nitrospirillum amazonense]|uniref:FAD:protein FMN transferase n=1 Tax=Nitrospirillum amazonense TaxID=28077 RepID=A0A560FQ35_9PROT|nr:FAD:protein FMN transferase [Nitrospirillum amazonense]TWB23724.1 thiamine biosynthesis lipoprotein [Nitrospirillum amazonense]
MSPSSPEARRARPLLGTLVEVRIDACDSSHGGGVEAALAAAFAAVTQVQALMSFHDPDSELSRLNRLGHRLPVSLHPWTADVLRRAQALHRATGGLFDPAVAPALAALDFLPAPLAAAPRGGSIADLVVGDGVACGVRPLWLDLGGIAKGYAVDRAVDALRMRGVRAGAVNAGGDLRLFGATPQPVVVRDPVDPARHWSLGEFRDIAIATSAGYYAARSTADGLVMPIIDPRDNRAVAVGPSVTVLADECATADALTKAVMLSGTPSPAWLQDFGAQAVRLEGRVAA